ncbi:MAG: zinc ribbon domain-containing protein [Planctomycetia bacterium]|nr:zinc ribbon domain-containing protein [Planctomycetia bacterium]
MQVETEIGKKGLAKQIKGLFSESDIPEVYSVKEDAGQHQRAASNSSNVYSSDDGNRLWCTNCGASIMPDKFACTNCGAAPTGHRKFCRFCGTALKPEQIICVKCKMPIGQLQSKNVPANSPYAFLKRKKKTQDRPAAGKKSFFTRQ